MLKLSAVLQVMRNPIRWFALLAVALLLGGVAIKSAQARVIDRVEVIQVGNEAEIQISFNVRIQYQREVSLKNGELRLYIKLLEADITNRQVSETVDLPPTGIAPHFTVAYPGLDSSLTIKFDKGVKYRVRPGKNGRSISVFVPVISEGDKPKSIAASVAALFVPPSTARTPEEVEREAKQYIDIALAALAEDQFESAVDALNRLLSLPPNKQSQAGQGLIGEAREKSGEFTKARVEYELYVKLYPSAKDIKRVKERLRLMPKEDKVRLGTAKKRGAEERVEVYGSFSQSYYNGQSRTDTTTSGITGTDTLSGIDQSTLISSLDITGRKVTDTTDMRIVVREEYRANFLPKTKNENRLSVFYVEQSSRDRNYLYRMGRQRGVAGGAPGQFDGAWLGYSLNSTWRVNGIVGTLVDSGGGDIESKKFSSLSVDLTRSPEQWNGSAYLIEQRVGHVVDRQAIGIEANYFDTESNYSGLFDYDRLFKTVNIALFQGNWTTESGNNYFMLIDRRKSPPLQITAALPAHASQSIPALVQSGVATDTLRAEAKALTQTSTLFMVGLTHPYSSTWRLGGDIRVNNTSSTEAAGAVAAAPGTGNVYSYSAQAIGNNLLFKNDLGVASASYVHSQTYGAYALAFTQVQTFREKLRLDVSVQLYNQKDYLDVRLTRITPSVKLGYRLTESASLDAEGGLEDSRTTSPTSSQQVKRTYFYLGYRWDFR
ncbi:MAG: tetratricopeptide repeat protein [Gallionella sp.]